MEVASVLEVSGAEEGGPKLSGWENPLRNCLRDGGFPRPGQPVQPVYGGFIEVPCPEFNLVQDDPAGSLEAAPTVAMSIFSIPCTPDTVEDSRFSYRGFMSGGRHWKRNMFRPGFCRVGRLLLFHLLEWKGGTPTIGSYPRSWTITCCAACRPCQHREGDQVVNRPYSERWHLVDLRGA